MILAPGSKGSWSKGCHLPSFLTEENLFSSPSLYELSRNSSRPHL